MEYEDPECVKCIIEAKELEKLMEFRDFLPVHHYSKHDPHAPTEIGKIEIVGGPILKFHLKPEIRI